MEPILVLASASQRRRQILEAIGVSFRVVVPDVDETPRGGEDAAALVLRLAREKATKVASRESLPVLAADTEVVLEGRILGKPRSSPDASHMLERLQGRSHEVLTGVCLVSGGRSHEALSRTQVAFAPMTPDEIAWYVETGEPMGKAGAYHIDGVGGGFIESISGSPSNVAGLPAQVVRSLLREAGLELPHG